MNSIKQWFASKGGVAHVLAAAFAFCIVAFEGYKPFHDWVLKLWADFPPDAQGFIVMAAGLWSFYKNWQKTQQPQYSIDDLMEKISSIKTTSTSTVVLDPHRPVGPAELEK